MSTAAKFWKNFGPSIKTFYFYVAAFVGLVMILVHGIILTKTFLEVEVFNVEYNYVDRWQCDQVYVDTEKGIKMTEEERALCEERAIERAKEDYGNNVKVSYAQGIAGLLFGLILWMTHFHWAKKNN